jgi:solute carrier family 25 folate transporter 32
VYEELRTLASAALGGGWAAAAAASAEAASTSGRGGGGGNGGGDARDLGPAATLACAGASKLAASVATYPVQVIRSRLQQRFEGRALVYRSAAHAVATTWGREGLRGFYKGLLPNLLRVMPQSAATIAAYERLMQLARGRRRQEAGGGANGSGGSGAVAAAAAVEGEDVVPMAVAVPSAAARRARGPS